LFQNAFIRVGKIFKNVKKRFFMKTGTATRSCRTGKRASHVYSPGVAAVLHVRAPPLLPLLLHQLLLL